MRILTILPNALRARFAPFLLLSACAACGVQAARLVWAIATPVGPIGDWVPRADAPARNNAEILLSGDPFFRNARSDSAVVTGLPLTLHGTRVDSATGRGSAIIATPDGVQASYAVGETILPGVTLAGVDADHVLIRRGSSDEALYLDQSIPATIATPATGATPQ